MLALEPHAANAGPTNPRADTQRIDLQTAFEKVQLVVVWTWELCCQFRIL